jgi:hypothetical protein
MPMSLAVAIADGCVIKAELLASSAVIDTAMCGSRPEGGVAQARGMTKGLVSAFVAASRSERGSLYAARESSSSAQELWRRSDLLLTMAPLLMHAPVCTVRRGPLGALRCREEYPRRANEMPSVPTQEFRRPRRFAP